MAAPTPTIVFRVITAPVVLGADFVTAIARMPFAGTLVRVSFVANATLTGVVTNNRTFNLYNRTASGVATTVMATKNFTNTVNAPVCQDTTIPLSATPANLLVVQGDVLQWESLHVGTGVADPGGMVEIEIQPFVGVSGS
jgi:hypothetical protein